MTVSFVILFFLFMVAFQLKKKGLSYCADSLNQAFDLQHKINLKKFKFNTRPKRLQLNDLFFNTLVSYGMFYASRMEFKRQSLKE